jgi:hypothetical protein
MFYSQEQYDEYQRELEGDGYSNEFQRCAAQQLHERPLQNQTAWAEMIARRGKFPTMVTSTRYCRVTDGILGSDTVVGQVFTTEAEALAYLDQCYNDEDIQHYLYRLPAAEPVKPTLPEIDDELPF